MYIYIYICIYIYIHIYGDVCTTQICTYIHINMFFDMFVYMHAACVYVMSVCALFLQGKRRPQEMLWSCTAWSTNFLNLGYKPRYLIYIILYINDYKRIWFEFEFHYLLLYIYIYACACLPPKACTPQLLDNCWCFSCGLTIYRYILSPAGALEKIMVQKGATQNPEIKSLQVEFGQSCNVGFKSESRPFRGDCHFCIRKRASLGFGRIIVSLWTLPRR